MFRKRMIVPVFVAIVVLLLTTTSALRNQQPHDPPSKKRPPIDKTAWPIADYQEGAGVTDKQAVRRARSEKYNKSSWGVNPSDVSDGRFRTHGIADYLPPLPVENSNLIVVGEVVNAEAHLSNDKSGVYSEFVAKIAEVIKKGRDSQISPGQSIDVQRDGGRVRFPSGRINLYSVSRENMPRVGQRYVFFLKGEQGDGPLDLLTGYALKDGKVSPLDDHKHFEAYKGMDEATFLSTVRGIATTPLQNSPE